VVREPINIPARGCAWATGGPEASASDFNNVQIYPITNIGNVTGYEIAIKSTPQYCHLMQSPLVKSFCIFALASTLSAANAETWIELPEEPNIRVNEFYGNPSLCVFATTIKIHSSWDASVEWRTGNLENKWVQEAKTNGKKCGVGKRLSRILEYSTKRWNEELSTFAGFNARCEQEPYSHCRGFRISKDKGSVQVGTFIRGALSLGTVYFKDGTNVSVASPGSVEPQPYQAAIFSNNEWMMIEASNGYLSHYNTDIDETPKVTFATSDGRFFSHTFPPACQLTQQTKSFEKPCFGMFFSANSLYIGEMIREYDWSISKTVNAAQGTGILIKRSTDRHLGNFVSGKRQGIGWSLSSQSGVMQVGTWDKDEFKGSVSGEQLLPQDLMGGNINRLCAMTSSGNKKAGLELTRRGLTCLNPLANEPFSTSSTSASKSGDTRSGFCNESARACNENNLCGYATVWKDGLRLWDNNINATEYVKEAKARRLDCGVQYSSQRNLSSNPSKPSDKRIVSSTSDNELCSVISSQLNQHVANSEYDKAEKALSLLQKMKCNGTAGSVSQPSQSTETSQPKQQKPLRELSCTAGPFFRKGLAGKAPSYSINSFDDSPRMDCKKAVQKCSSVAELDMKNFQRQGSTYNRDSYKTRCNQFGECTTRPYKPGTGGGFMGGFIGGLNEVARERTVFGEAFQACLINEGFNANER